MLTFPVTNRNKSDDKKVTGYKNVHNHAYVFWTCPILFSFRIFMNLGN